MRCVALAAGVALAAIACAARPDKSADWALASRPPAAAQEPARDPCDLERLTARAARLRGLGLRSPVRCELLAPPLLAERAFAVALRDTPPKMLEGQAQLMKLLEVASARFDMKRALRALIEQELAGFYDPVEDALYVNSELEGKPSEAALIHELVHALQDQHFDLGRRMRAALTSDEVGVLSLLAEGDATSAMVELPERGRVPESTLRTMAAFGALVAEATPSDVEVPALLRRSLYAPYTDGLRIVEGLREAGGWAAVDALWRATPKQSAQLLHPESVLPGETPMAAAPHWRDRKASFDDVIGEHGLRLLFEEWQARSKAETAAAGWRADRLSVFADDAGGALVWQLVFAGSEDADEALHAFGRGYFRDAARKPELGVIQPASFTRGCVEGSANPMAVVSHGARIVIAVQARAHEPDACSAVLAWAQATLAAPVGAAKPGD